MKLHSCVLILFLNFLLAFDLQSAGAETYLEFIDHVSNVGVTEIEESPSGTIVYAGTHLTGKDESDTITVYAKNTQSGALSELYSYTQGINGVDGLTGINDIKITSDNSCLFVSSNKLIIPFNEDGHLASFSINSTSGELSFVEAIDRLDPNNGDFIQARKIVVSEDNYFLYMSVSGNILAFEIDTSDCQLSYLDKYAYSGGFLGGYGLELGHSNEFLYLTLGDMGQPNSGGLVMFHRNQNTGVLSQIAVYTNGMDDIIDLENPIDLEVSEDGRYLYTLAYDRGAVVVFEIDQQTGDLSFDSSYVNLTNGIEGMVSPRHIEISSDQNYMVITSEWNDALVVFTRDQADGSMSYDSTYYNNKNGFNHMTALRDILLSDSGHLYTTATVDDAIQIIDTNPEINDIIFVDGFDLINR